MFVISAGTDGDADGEGSESSDQKVCSLSYCFVEYGYKSALKIKTQLFSFLLDNQKKFLPQRFGVLLFTKLFT